MAKKTKKPVVKKEKERKPSKIRAMINFFGSTHFRFTLGLFLLVFGVYLAISIVSYCFSGAFDQIDWTFDCKRRAS